MIIKRYHEKSHIYLFVTCIFSYFLLVDLGWCSQSSLEVDMKITFMYSLGILLNIFAFMYAKATKASATYQYDPMVPSLCAVFTSLEGIVTDRSLFQCILHWVLALCH